MRVAYAVLPVVLAASALSAGRGDKNFQILSVEAPLSAQRGQAVGVVVKIRATGLAGEGGTVELMEGEKVLDGSALEVTKDDEVLTAKLAWRAGAAAATQPAANAEQAPPLNGGAAAGGPAQDAARPRFAAGEGGSAIHKIRVAVAVEPGEKVRHDNAVDLHVLVSPPRVRVLCIDTPRAEQKAYRSVLESSLAFHVAWLLPTPAGKLFSQGELEGRKILALPGEDDLQIVDVVVLGDLESTYFRPAQLAALERFVAGGGGLLALGGKAGLSAGGYGGTPVEDALPVELGKRKAPIDQPFLPRLTEAGTAHPVMGGVGNYLAGPNDRPPDTVTVSTEKRPLPDLAGLNPLGTVRKDAAVLAAQSPARPGDAALPLLVCGRHGGGRSTVLASDSTWRWTGPRAGGDAVHARLWRQLVCWTAGASADRGAGEQALLAARADRAWQRVGDTVKVQALVRPLPGQEVEQVRCVVQPEGELADAAIKLRSLGDGLWEGSFRVKQLGMLGVRVTAEAYDGKPLAADDLRVRALPAD